MKLYGFLQDKRWHEDFGHILIGMVPFYGWYREHRQWPPGDVIVLAWSGLLNPLTGKAQGVGNWGTEPPHGWKTHTSDGMKIDRDTKEVVPLDRVADSYRDFFGYALGDAIRTGFLIGVIAGMWWVR